MDINMEIEKIVKYRNASLLFKDRKNEFALASIIDRIKNDYKNYNFNFSEFENISLKQMDKVRHIKKYKDFSTEEVLCIYLKRVLDRKFHIKYPNRNEYMHSLFDMISALSKMNDFSIYRFDFKDFFNTVSSEYVFKKFILASSLERDQLDLLEKFVKETKYAYAGLNTSNIICEIIAKHFDEILTQKFKHYGLIFYRRYIDDGILIFNTRIDEAKCLSIINETINEVFDDKGINVIKRCKTRINESKSKYISIRDMKSNIGSITLNGASRKKLDEKEFDFLGYEFRIISWLYKKKMGLRFEIVFKYGITQQKIDKYTNRIKKIIDDYIKDKDVELLRHRLKAFTHRTVYQVQRNNSMIWKSKGFISNYTELRYRTDSLTKETTTFLKKSILNYCRREFRGKLPYFLKGKEDESIYSLMNNLENNRTLLFVEPIGINQSGLEKLCKQIGIETSNKKYEDLVGEYLIKVNVGH
ncbi:reverse transcriptase domain-containing protein [Ruminococcus albus]|uniref:Reverse transcriptase (RNA-dependent DNA polymerase) n=1 Tax=Ruminococcus albus TaxID=1264 RepID=A0A1H7PCE4_RUMAL|nr:reverse transcriptase domain-containing protein [Ruminococcus albus]SEL33329.1 Reverse transcriptase (RNA-dependent DNA polymerase) [Ruminococcus albus]